MKYKLDIFVCFSLMTEACYYYGVMKNSADWTCSYCSFLVEAVNHFNYATLFCFEGQRHGKKSSKKNCKIDRQNGVPLMKEKATMHLGPRRE